MIALDIFADPVCPFCLIGYERLRRALAERPGHPFQLAWHPFQLNPSMPREGMARADYLQAKFGQDGAVKMHQQLLEIAASDALPLDPLKVLRQPNTLDALRLVYWAGLEEKATAVMEGVMAAHWYEGRDIGDPRELVRIAQAAGLDGTMIGRLLASDADCDTIASRDAHARERGITAVPTFIVANTHAITGTQPKELWLKVIDELSGAPSDAILN
ncbi:DsbA family oxidoreductase [Thioclava sp. GXIMD4216]|uniref:DsbA family oxidoreductase n=1 Tax=Thioclava sp. GXIMD4216 TaxID=3131929 RepID=UPI0030D2642A